MMPSSAREGAIGHLAEALFKYARALDVEKHAADHAGLEILADQGHALRMTIAHSASAITAALLELADATREMVVP